MNQQVVIKETYRKMHNLKKIILIFWTKIKRVFSSACDETTTSKSQKDRMTRQEMFPMKGQIHERSCVDLKFGRF